MGLVQTLVLSALVIPVVTLAGALALVLSQPAAGRLVAPAGGSLDFGGVRGAPVPVAPEAFLTRDGSAIALRRYAGPEGAPLLVLLHGSGWHGGMFEGLARALAAGGHATVLVPDMRGHGAAPVRRGDLDRIEQVMEDVADLIAAHRAPGQRVVLGGFSLGGGTVIRFAGGPDSGMIDRALLLAPFVHHEAPTTRPASGGWAVPLLRRIIGLSILNATGIGALDYLTAVRYRFPAFVLDGPAGGEATPDYSWRLYKALVPGDDWQAAVRRLPPFLLVAGARDEAFVAEDYAPTLGALTDLGRYVVLPGLGHLALLDAPEVAQVVADWLHEP